MKNSTDLNDSLNKTYYMNKEVIVLKWYEDFQLVKIKYLYSNLVIVVDSNALSVESVSTRTISLELIGG